MKMRYQFNILSGVIMILMILCLSVVGWQINRLIRLKDVESQVSRTFLTTREYMVSLTALVNTSGLPQDHIAEITQRYAVVSGEISRLETLITTTFNNKEITTEMKNMKNLWSLVELDETMILRRFNQLAEHIPDYETSISRNSLQQIAAYASRKMPEITATYFDSIFSSLSDLQFADNSFRLVYGNFDRAIRQEVALQTRLTLILLTASVLFLFTAVSLLLFLFSSVLTKRISLISSGIHRISRKELNHELPVNGRDELASLAGNSNKVISFLKQNISSFLSVTDFLKRISSSLTANMDKTRKTSLEIQNQTETINKQMDNLKQNVRSVHDSLIDSNRRIQLQFKNIEEETMAVASASASMENMNRSIGTITSLARKQKEEVNNLKSISEKGCQQMLETKDIITLSRNSLEGIQNAANIIRSVAARTSLLSMNAAIEAAHAGDAGSGFSVVAEEIRKLAENSNSNTKTIDLIIKELAENINRITELGDAGNQTFQGINNNVIRYSEVMEKIVSSMERTSQGSSDINSMMGYISEAIGTIRESSRGLKDNSEAIEELVGKVEDSLNITGSSLESIRSGVDDIVDGIGLLDNIGRSSTEKTRDLHNTLSAFEI
ncbi:MAG: methyl-accepting chemotaxis protein [Spirochaetales bacterium]|nr:methyl-accepting chemotaxis protein [Spirochaetales bacterium]